MQQVVKQARKHKPSILMFNQLIQARKFGEGEAWAGYYPLVSLSSDVRAVRGERHAISTTGISGRQLVYAFDGPQLQAKRAHEATSIARYQKKVEENNVQFETETTFLECWRIQQQHDQILSLHKSTQAAYGRAAHQNKLELIDKNNWLTEVETHANNISTVHLYKDAASIFEKRLAFLTGYTINLNINPDTKTNTRQITTVAWNNSPQLTLKPLSYYQKLSMRNRPEIQEREHRIRELQRTYELSTKSNLPKLSISAETSYVNHIGTLTQPQRITQSIGGTISFPFLDIKSDYETERINANKLEAILAKQSTEQAIKSEVETTYHQLSQAYTRLRSQNFSYERSRNEFTLRKQELSAGLISPVTFKNAQATWDKAQFDWINQQVNLAIKKRELLFKCGYPLSVVL